MDRAVEMDVAELVRADIEVDTVDVIAVAEVLVRRGLDLRPSGNHVCNHPERSLKRGWRGERALCLARKSGECFVGHGGFLVWISGRSPTIFDRQGRCDRRIIGLSLDRIPFFAGPR